MCEENKRHGSGSDDAAQKEEKRRGEDDDQVERHLDVVGGVSHTVTSCRNVTDAL